MAFLPGSLPIVVDDQTNDRAWGEILSLARAHHLSAYDAACPSRPWITDSKPQLRPWAVPGVCP